MATSSASYDFDTTFYLDTNDNSTFDFPSGTFTIVAWVYPHTVVDFNMVCANRNATTGGWAATLEDTELAIDPQGSTRITSSGLAFAANTWQGCAFLVNAETDMDFHKMSTEGAFTSDIDNAYGSLNATANDLWIAGDPAFDNASERFDGNMAHLQIFNRLLSTTEIRNALFSPGSLVNGLVGYWPLYGQLNPSIDLSATGADATESAAKATSTNGAIRAIPQQMMIT